MSISKKWSKDFKSSIAIFMDNTMTDNIDSIELLKVKNKSMTSSLQVFSEENIGNNYLTVVLSDQVGISFGHGANLTLTSVDS